MSLFTRLQVHALGSASTWFIDAQSFCPDSPPDMKISALALFFCAASLSRWGHSVEIPAGAKKLNPGRYVATVKLDKARAATDGIEAEIIIPAGISGPTAAVVFFHGNARDKKVYLNRANFLVAAAALRKVIIISVQNWWPLSGDKLEATEDSRRATNLLMHKLVNAGVVQGNRVYLSGFSAGGLLAVSTFVHSIDHFRDEAYKQKFTTSLAALIKASKKDPEDYFYNFKNPGKEVGFFPYAGVFSIRGNFYMKYFPADNLLNADETRKHFAAMTAGKKIVLTVGGDKEARDVQKEVPTCRDYLKRILGMRLDYHEFGDEGHDIYPSDQEILWQMIP